MWPLAACRQKSPQEQYKDIPDDQIDATIVFVDSNYLPDSTAAVVDDVTKVALSGAHVAPTWARLWSHWGCQRRSRGSELGEHISQQPERRSGRFKVWEVAHATTYLPRSKLQ